jgi:CDP-glycerol glycerophosphotransferase (TagB/SpsB family)
VASFSFGAGNARKLLSLPLYALGRAVTLVVPRTRDRWVFGCGVGIADGALALWHRAAADRVPAVWLVGSDREARDAAALGIPAVRKQSLRGFWLTARARVVVVTHGFGDVNRFAVSGAVLVQLWHGIPLKRIGLDSPETTRVPRALQRLPGSALLAGALAGMYRSATRRIDVLPAASDLVRGRLESAFSLGNGAVPVTGEPRVDVLSQGSAAERRARARGEIERLAGPLNDRRLVLYAPTWRDGEVDPAVPDAADWSTIEETLRSHNALLLVRSHPLGAGDYAAPSGDTHTRSLGADVVIDVTPLLPGIDLLITDFSSLMFDASLVPLPTVFFAPDAEQYERRRGLYGRYDEVTAGDAARTWAGAMAQVGAVLSHDHERGRRIARAEALSQRVHAYRDGGNTDRVYRVIVAKVSRRIGRSGVRQKGLR